MEKYAKYLKDGKRTHCTFCNSIYPTEFISKHYKTDYHLEQVCRKEFGMSAEKILSCEEEENKYIGIEEQFGFCMRKDIYM
jgi:hypothetical protein